MRGYHGDGGFHIGGHYKVAFDGCDRTMGGGVAVQLDEGVNNCSSRSKNTGFLGDFARLRQ